MKPSMTGIILLAGVSRLALGQTAQHPLKFEAADVHASAKSTSPMQSKRVSPLVGDRYQIKDATMVDLIQLAYSVTPDKILGGPNWLEFDRFDVTAKAVPDTTPETLRQMLQSLLAERFKLATHSDTRPVPAYALVAGKKPLLKQATGSEEPACKPRADAPIPGGMAIRVGAQVAASMGMPTTINLGPGGTMEYDCRNMTMASFAENLPGLASSQLGSSPVVDDTGLTGKWNFEFRVTFISGMENAERITIFDSVEKDLGLKLEERWLPLPVLVVDSANRTLIPNPPGTAEALPAIPPPSEFEVASVKRSASDLPFRNRYQLQPGGHLIVQNATLRFLVSRAFSVSNPEAVAELPAFADTELYDIDAKAPVAPPPGPVDYEWVAPMVRSLLVQRFKMTYHTEERPVTAYTLVQAKPKMKKADPESRIFCRFPPPPPSPPGSRIMTCQNTTMAQLAERLQGMSQELSWPVADATELTGGWDFTLIWTPGTGVMPGPPGSTGPVAASEPTGALTFFEAVEKQLGLKLEKQKRPAPVIVIDHIEQKPTEN
jgi:uncharacterized protein (TIGR03435 family)